MASATEQGALSASSVFAAVYGPTPAAGRGARTGTTAQAATPAIAKKKRPAATAAQPAAAAKGRRKPAAASAKKHTPAPPAAAETERTCRRCHQRLLPSRTSVGARRSMGEQDHHRKYGPARDHSPWSERLDVQSRREHDDRDRKSGHHRRDGNGRSSGGGRGDDERSPDRGRSRERRSPDRGAQRKRPRSTSSGGGSQRGDDHRSGGSDSQRGDDHRSGGSASPSPSPHKKAKKHKREKHEKHKKEKRGKENRSKKRKKHSRRSRSLSSDSSGRSPQVSSRRSRVTTTESRRVADAPLTNPRSSAGKLMAAAQAARKSEGGSVGRIMSEEERKRAAAAAAAAAAATSAAAPARRSPKPAGSLMAAAKTQKDRSTAAGSNGGAARPQPSLGAAAKSSTMQPGGVMQPRSVARKSGTDSSKRSRMADRPVLPLQSKKRPPSAEAPPAAAAGTAKLCSTHSSPRRPTAAATQAPAQNSCCVSCCECEDQPADVHCVDCNEDFCQPCWGGQHRRGKRSLHKLRPILGAVLERTEQPAEPSLQQPTADALRTMANEELGDDTAVEQAAGSEYIGPAMPPGGMASLYNNDSERRLKANRERMKWLPLRLTADERTILSFLQGALHVSEYTDKVDVFSHSDKVDRQIEGMAHYLRTQCGLQLANSFKKGERLVRAKLGASEPWFGKAFEVGRRYKIMNPQKMRSDYGKMMYLLMDAQRSDVKQRLGMNLVNPIQTVGKLLKEKHGEGILGSEDLDDATRDLSDATFERSQQLDLQKQKLEATARIVEKYTTKDLSSDEIMRVLESISDANNFLQMNERPVTRMLELLKTNFDSSGSKGSSNKNQFSLQIGKGGNFRFGGGVRSYAIATTA